MSALREARRRLATRGRRAPVLFLDFDGTLAPVTRDPAAARPLRGARPLVARLAARMPTFLISGRRRADLRRRAGIRGARYVGLHGLETGARGAVLGITQGEADAVRRIAAAWRRLAGGVPGAELEDKGLAATLHVRGVARLLQPDLLRRARLAALPSSSKKLIAFRRGRQSLEIVPSSAKGKHGFVEDVLTELYGRHWRGTVFPIYVGDDDTDRRAIRLADRYGLGLWVRSNEARPEPVTTLSGPEEVLESLRLLDRSVRTTFKGRRSSASPPRWTAKARSAAKSSRLRKRGSARAPRASSSPKATAS